MKKTKTLFNKPQKPVIVGLTVAIILVIVFIITRVMDMNITNETVEQQEYTQVEQLLADNVINYLTMQLGDLPEEECGRVVDEAVDNYETVMNSDVSIITGEHTEAIKNNIRKAILEHVSGADRLTDDELELLSTGITEMIWNTIISQIDEASGNSTFSPEYDELLDSLQNQVTSLEEQNMRISITASIKDNYIDPDTIIAAVQQMSPEELEAFSSSLGVSEEEIEAIYKEMISEGPYGADGRDGVDGQNGADGRDGVDGKDGIDGRTTYIAYANDASGNGFSLSPTENSLFIGTCLTSDSVQPADASKYKWQQYRKNTDFYITYETEDDGSTSVHISNY